LSSAPGRRLVEFSPSNIWRVGLVVLAVIAVGLLVRFVVGDGGGVLFVIVMAWFGAMQSRPGGRPAGPAHATRLDHRPGDAWTARWTG
jgi:hypothetical protein